MKRYLLIVALISVFFKQSDGQTSESFKIDSLRIDHITRILPLLKGTNRVDSMLLLCVYYDYVYPGIGRFTFSQDTMLHYASLAYAEARHLGYKKGIALALLNLKSDSARAKNTFEAIRIGEEINDDKILGLGYSNLLASDFKEYVKNNKTAIDHFHKSGDTLREAEVYYWLFNAYLNRGESETALDYVKRSSDILLSQKEQKDFVDYHHILMQSLLSGMANLYSFAGDYENAIKYLRKNEDYGKAHKTYYQDFSPNIAEVYCKMGQADSASYYADTSKFRDQWVRMHNGEKAWGRNVLGQSFLLKKHYDDAVTLFKGSVAYFRKTHNPVALPDPILFLAQAYTGQNDYSKALQYAREGLDSANKWNLRPEMMHGYQLLSLIFHEIGNNDSAYNYLLKYIEIKDSMLSRQSLFKLYNYQKVAEDEKKQAQLLLLNKDNKIKDQQLKQEALARNGLISGLLGFILIVFFILRSLILKRKNEKLKHTQLENEMKLQQLENEKKHAELLQQATELEMQALRAQMNPHFIFNCLSSINRIILKNESKTASDYLTRFSRLIRMVLINSQKSMIPLEDELQMLRLYLDMERLRFKDSFDYSIIFTNAIDETAVLIPPLLLQPFCENAVWHGLMQKEGQGHLNVELSIQGNVLRCIITDNGIGREKAASLKSKSAEKDKSLGLQLTAQRLALLNQNKETRAFYTIEDIVDENKDIAGTKVIIKIAYKRFMEEFA
jgi:tetratricopeptide (TPR) repeat protein